MQGPDPAPGPVQPVPETYHPPIQQEVPENVNVNVDAFPEEPPELESDRERERDRSDSESDFLILH